MEVKTLYRYEREPGKITVSTNKPDAEYTELFRVIADEGKMLVNKDGYEAACVDTDYPEDWMEIDAPEEKEEVLQ